MKKTTSFHLEEDIIKEIEEYKQKFKLSSRNIALERMLLERRNILSLPGLFMNNKIEYETEEIKIDRAEDKLKKSIESNFSNMPE